MQGYFASRGVSDAAEAHQQAIIALGRLVHRQALVMAFSDAFAVMGIVLAFAAAALLLIRKPAAASKSGVGAH